MISLVMLISLHSRAPLAPRRGQPTTARASLDVLFANRAAVPVDAALVDLVSQHRGRFPMPTYRWRRSRFSCRPWRSIFSAFLKRGWCYPDGTAIYYALHLDELNTWIAQLWKDELWLSRPLTLYVWWPNIGRCLCSRRYFGYRCVSP